MRRVRNQRNRRDWRGVCLIRMECAFYYEVCVCVFKPKAEGEARVLMTKVRVIERKTGEGGLLKGMMTLKEVRPTVVRGLALQA